MKKLRLLHQLLKTSGTLRLIYGFLCFFVLIALLLPVFEPGLKSIGDSLWFCFSSITTIGYGDLQAVTLVGRLLTVLLSLYGILLVAILTAVVVNYVTELQRSRAQKSVAKFVDALEHLEDLSHDELAELSKRIRSRRYKL